jgi:elongator complex protein 3
MATTTVTTTVRKKDVNLPPENERYLRCCADLANALIEDYEASKDPKKPQRDVNLNSLRSKLARKHKLNNIPPLTAIIAAIPEQYKKYILPKLVAKPISESACPFQTPVEPPLLTFQKELRLVLL